MNITQYRKKIKTFGDLDFSLGKEKCYIIYKGQILMYCDRNKNDQYSFYKRDEDMIIKEMKYVDSILDVYKIITIIIHPIRSYRRFKHYGAI